MKNDLSYYRTQRCYLTSPLIRISREWIACVFRVSKNNLDISFQCTLYIYTYTEFNNIYINKFKKYNYIGE